MSLLEDFLQEYPNKTLNTFSLEKKYPDYLQLVAELEALIAKGVLSPFGKDTNGRSPVLHSRYKINITAGLDIIELQRELRCYPPELDTIYYFNNLKEYLLDRGTALKLANFFNSPNKIMLKNECSVNERSFQIFYREKELLSKNVEKILRRLKLSIEKLNCYHTPEPFFYVNYSVEKIKNILIIENKDTFHTLRRIGNCCKNINMFGIAFDLLIYGEGKKIERSLTFLQEISNLSSQLGIYYFGDLDYEGIGIYQRLKEKHSDFYIQLFLPLYNQLVSAVPMDKLPDSEQQAIDIDDFLNCFSKSLKIKIRDILAMKRYIPQEALSAYHFNIFIKEEFHVQ